MINRLPRISSQPKRTRTVEGRPPVAPGLRNGTDAAAHIVKLHAAPAPHTITRQQHAALQEVMGQLAADRTAQASIPELHDL